MKLSLLPLFIRKNKIKFKQEMTLDQYITN